MINMYFIQIGKRLVTNTINMCLGIIKLFCNCVFKHFDYILCIVLVRGTEKLNYRNYRLVHMVFFYQIILLFCSGVCRLIFSILFTRGILISLRGDVMSISKMHFHWSKDKFWFITSLLTSQWFYNIISIDRIISEMMT